MTPRYIDCLRYLLDREGGRVDHPSDKGGRTAFGVTQWLYNKWRARRKLKPRDVWNITPMEVLDLYQECFWDPIHGGALPMGVDLVALDCAVNNGEDDAARWLQAAVGAKVDGRIGPKTLAATAAADPRATARKMLDFRGDYYRELVDEDSSQRVFLNGWLLRNAHLRGTISV